MEDIQYIPRVSTGAGYHKEKWVDKALPKPEKDVEFKVGGNKEYKVEAIIDSVVYSQQANSNQRPSFYYFVS